MENGIWDKLTDTQLVNNIKLTNCEKSLNELINRHSGLCFKIMARFSKSFYANNLDITELYNDKNLIIWNSANSFKEDKEVKFSTWLANQIKYSCLNCLNKKSKDRLVTTEDKSLDALKEKNPFYNRVEAHSSNNLFEFTENILSQLKDPRIKKIFSLRYSNMEKKPSWCVIADKISVSTQTAINLHNRGIEILRKKIKSEKMLDNV